MNSIQLTNGSSLYPCVYYSKSNYSSTYGLGLSSGTVSIGDVILTNNVDLDEVYVTTDNARMYLYVYGWYYTDDLVNIHVYNN